MRSPKSLLLRMKAFTQLGRVVQNFHLLENRDEPTVLKSLIGIFPNPSLISTYVGLIGYDEDYSNPLKVYPKVLRLKVPQQVINLRIQESLLVRRTYEQFMAEADMPSILLTLSKTRRANIELATLFTLVGMSPQIALEELQDAVQARLHQMN